MRASALAVLVVLAMPSVALAQASRTEKSRQQLLDKLGLDRVSQPKPLPPEPAQTEAPEQVPAPNVATDVVNPTAALPPSFKKQIAPWLNQKCGACHKKDGPASATAFLLGQGGERDHASAIKFVNTRAPKSSGLVLKTTGVAHGGGAVATMGSAEVRRLLAWISAGARYADSVADASVVSVPVSRPAATRKGREETQAAPAPTVAVQEAAPPLAVASEPVIEQQAVPSASAAFRDVVHPVLGSRCMSCHSSTGMAARTRLVLVGDVMADYASVLPLVTPGAAAQSLLLVKAGGQAHMAVLTPGQEPFLSVAAWINNGAPNGTPLPKREEPSGPATSVAPDPVQPAPPTTSPNLSHPSALASLAKPGVAFAGFRLNGRFDMNLERRGVSGQPFAQGQTQFQNYHHFLFLSRDGVDEPVNFTVELTALTFWEANLRVSPKQATYDLRLKVGKLIVPFGAEPLFHQSYGGLQGFDQKVLPVFWAQNGFAAKFSTRLKHTSLVADAFVLRGYGLREAEGVLNLQSDFSPNDDLRPAYGLRLNASLGPVSAYYSLLVNGLGFGRTLVMQAADLSVWRWHGVPILERFTFGLGFLRADISGGGAGKDYFHFASYYQARFYVTDALYVQYRQGLRTFNNRRGIYQDATRFTSEDGSAHNVGIVWRHKAWTTGAFGFWNLEKTNEVRDDFFRLVVAYEF